MAAPLGARLRRVGRRREARLARRREKETAELRKLQQERKAQQAKELEAVGKRYIIAIERNEAFHPEANGFEFSTAEIERYLAGLSPDRIASRGHSVGAATSPRDLLTSSCSAKSQVEAA